MEINLDFERQPLGSTDFLRAVAWKGYIDSVVGQEGIERYLEGVPLEEQIANCERTYTSYAERLDQHRLYEVRYNAGRINYEAAMAAETAARVTAEADGATDEEAATLAGATALRVGLYEIMLGGVADANGVVDNSVILNIIMTWEGVISERENLRERKNDLALLKKDRVVHDKAFGAVMKALKDSTGHELRAIILREEILRNDQRQMRPKSVIFESVMEKLMEELEGEPQATRAHILASLSLVPPCSTWIELRDILSRLNYAKILMTQHLLMYPADGEVVQDSSFKRALKKAFKGGDTQIEAARTTVTQMASSVSWEDMRKRMLAMINNELDHIDETKAAKERRAREKQNSVAFLSGQDGQRDNETDTMGARQPGSPARSRSPGVGACRNWEAKGRCEYGDRCTFLHGSNDPRFAAGGSMSRGASPARGASPGRGIADGPGLTPRSSMKSARK
jgi:hypothetical protein